MGLCFGGRRRLVLHLSGFGRDFLCIYLFIYFFGFAFIWFWKRFFFFFFFCFKKVFLFVFFFFFNIVLTWKIVRGSEVSVIYIYRIHHSLK